MSKPYTKPVFLARFPFQKSMDRLAEFYEHLEKKLGKDYHVLAIVDNATDEVKFEVFNALDSELADIESLKKEIKESFNNLETQE